LASPCSALLPYTTLFRSVERVPRAALCWAILESLESLLDMVVRGILYLVCQPCELMNPAWARDGHEGQPPYDAAVRAVLSEVRRSEEHTSELQSRENLVC